MATLSTIPLSQVSCPPEFRGGAAGALVIGGALGSLGVVRSLGRRGVPVWVLTGNHLIAGYSRFAKKSFAWPGPDNAYALDYLLALARRHHLQGWVLFPGGDAEARFIALNHETLAKVFRLITPAWHTLQWAADKRLTYQLAAEIGIACPWTLRPRNRSELAAIACPFPLILKPSARNSINAFTHAKAWRADGAESLLARYDEAVLMVGAESVLVQELIPGDGSCQFSYAAVCEHGVPAASLVANRRRQYPIDFGFTSTFVQSVENLEIEELACRFLQATGYSGLAELEFKYDRRDGQYKLLDVNARTWAWLSLGAKAGVDFPWLMWNQALGEPIERTRGHAGCSWTHASRDLAAAFAEIRAGSLTLSGYLRSFQSTSLEFAAFAKDDPLPGLLDLPLAIWRVVAH
jgi:D-aspartate ligase